MPRKESVFGRATSQVGSHRSVTKDASVSSRAYPGGICGRQSGPRTA